MEVHLAKGLAEHIRSASANRVVQDLLALLVAVTIARSRFSVHSLIIRHVLGSHRYDEYLALMTELPFISRSARYVPRAVAEATGKQAFCKSWCYNGLPQAYGIGNINAWVGSSSGAPAVPAALRGRLVRWEFTSAFAERLVKAFSWYLRQYDVSPDQVRLFQEITELVGGTLTRLEPPDLDYEDVLEICGGDEEKARANWDALSKCTERVSGKCHYDFGHRIYHPLTNIKKEIRRLFRIDGEPMVEVDMHATFPTIVAAKLAPPGERERLLVMIESGDFYGRMAVLLNIQGVDRSQLKARFQRDVLFTFRPGWSEIWQAFRREFPGTAWRLAQIRDGTDTVVDERLKYDVNGRRHLVQTRWGQRRLSRILSRLESEIFLQRALLRLFWEHGIRAVPIHDCLMVAERHAAVAKRVIEQAAAEVLGFVPVVKIGGRYELDSHQTG